MQTNKEKISYWIETYGDMVLRLAVSYLKNLQDAEDIVQTVLMTLFQKNPVFEHPEHEKAWILRSTINACKNKRKLFWNRNVCSMEEIAEPSYQEEKDSTVLDAVMSLSAPYRVAVYLYYYEGYKTAEIAKIIGKREATVRSLLHRAREQLKQKLTEEYDFA